MDVKIDLGCGTAKREGYVGLDYVELPGVDHVLDLTHEPFPFEDGSVAEVFSAHFLEHIEEPNHVFSEIGRVCRDGARIEFWTPYGFSNEAFVYGHEHFLTELTWTQFCVSHRDVFADMLRGRWLLRSINYVVPPPVQADLARNGVTMDFAIRYLKDVVEEFGVEIEYRSELEVPPVQPVRYWSDSRFGLRQDLATTQLGDRPPGRARQVVRAVTPRPLRSLARRVVDAGSAGAR